MITVSHSKIKTWRRCRKAYAYKYVEELRPRRKSRPLLFGSVCHEMIEAYANGDSPKAVLHRYYQEAEKLFTAEVEDYVRTLNEAGLLMDQYFKYYQKSGLRYVALKGKLAEHEFEVPLCAGINLKGKVDAVARTKDKRVWLVEHKTHKEVPDEGVRFRDLQTVMYVDILPKIGIKNIAGVLWDYIRSKPPSVPSLLKNGTLSTAKIDTLPDVYLAEIKKHKLNPKDYREKLDELKGSERTFFKRVFMPINEKLSEKLLSETVETAKEIAEKAGKDCTRNITRDCSWCEFEGLCRAELLDLDTDFIRKREFTHEEGPSNRHKADRKKD